MKASILAVPALALMIAFQPALAQTPKPSGKSAQVKPSVVSAEDFDKQLAQAQAHMKQMQEQMDQIAQTQDPQERQRLLQDHWTSMQAAMSSMRGMWHSEGKGCCGDRAGTMGPGMMKDGSMMKWGHMRGHYNSLTPEQIKQRQYMMDQYMPMQQSMMDHMMWHQRWMSQQPPSAAK